MKCFYFLLGLIVLGGLSSCDKNEVITPPDEISKFSGTGDYSFTEYAPLAGKPVRVFYHIPENTTPLTPVLMVFHGGGRDGEASRDALISKSNEGGFIVVAPQFSSENYPGGDFYNLGNIFVDGDNPSPSTLNDEEEWTFSVVDPIFEGFKTISGNETETYDVFGHSAGAQFAHRLLMFKPQAKINRVVEAAAGWFTMPDNSVDFPYGTSLSPVQDSDLAYFFSAQMTVMVGALDTDPNSFDLRHNEQADAQGLNRYSRATYFFTQSQNLAEQATLTFNWNFTSLPNVGHEYAPSAIAAANILY